MRSFRMLLLVIVPSAAMSCSPEQPPNKETTVSRSPLFPAPGPIVDADPSVREKRTIHVPRALRIEAEGDRVGVSIDEASLEILEIEVGKGMVTGFKMEGSLGTGYTSGDRASSGTTYVPRVPGETVEMRVVLFETDIPPQHEWSPTSGRYRELWTKTIRGTHP